MTAFVQKDAEHLEARKSRGRSQRGQSQAEAHRGSRAVLCRQGRKGSPPKAGAWVVAPLRSRTGPERLGLEAGSAWLRHKIGLESCKRGGWREKGLV